MRVSLQFLGAAGTVTGSRHLLRIGDKKVLIDCGLFQGLKELHLQNREPFPVPPESIDAVILTHAHLDHSGYLPILVKNGFRGPIFCTSATRDLTEILLADAAHLEEEDADFSNRNGFSKHTPAFPLFNLENVHAVCDKLKTVELEKWRDLFPGAKFRLQPSGHIVGSAFVEVEAAGLRVVFSGDLGRGEPLVLKPRALLSKADILVVESTCGDRLHPTEIPLLTLGKIIRDTATRKGNVLIPSFAVGRTQDILHLLAELKRKRMIPDGLRRQRNST
jgi:metallo-beta-lactamase family protein